MFKKPSNNGSSCNPESGAVFRIREWSGRWTGWALVALGFSLPLSTGGTSVLLGVILLLWLIGGDFCAQGRKMLAHPLALAALILFLLYVLGLFYGKPSDRLIFDVTHFPLLAIFLMLFRDEKMRRYALRGFLSAMLLMLILSYLAWFSLLPPIDYLHVVPGQGLVIQDRITYGFFMTLAAFFLAVEGLFAASGSRRIALALLVSLAVFNLLFMIDNRTALIVLLILAAYFLIGHWRWKGVLAFSLAVALLISINFLFPGSPLYQRVVQADREFKNWQPDKAEQTSVGYRLEFYRNTLKIIREHPVFGVGVGGFAEAYAKQVKDFGMAPTDNPHNEYLMVTAQLGLLGLAALLYLFCTQWRLATRLPTRRETLLARGVVLAFVVGCLVNSFLTDYDEGVFFIWISALLFSELKPLEKK